ncbi:MAG: glycine--tRNA ligase [Candidatus Marinimicrobia bacterium]|nr:glycine--tRNA ligase [Candidatus Neomarinimicrobiota bacterium]
MSNIPENFKEKIISLCKRRGFIFQSSEIYGGLKSAYDYGPLGVELKRNLMNEWWKSMVHKREDITGLDASIIMHPKVWEASGHLAGFSDPLVDCLVSKERFRADKAPKLNVEDDIIITCNDKGQAKNFQKIIEDRFDILLKREGKQLKGLKLIDDKNFGFFEINNTKPIKTFEYKGYVSPTFGCPFLSEERQFNLMFRSQIGPVDVLGEITTYIKKNKNISSDELRIGIDKLVKKSAVYLRPETAQAMFVQFLNCQQTMSMKIPFGIAQMGKSFRNEITTEHFIFRSCEFEQMEMEFFVEPGTQEKWLDYWVEQRMSWWQKFANHPENFRYRAHDESELAHYADACYDIEYKYPWGYDELEGVASRTDYDLKKHAEQSGTKLSYYDQQKTDPETGKNGWRYTPYVIEPAAGATRGLLVYLMDAYTEEIVKDAKGNETTRIVMKLHPRLAPIKVAVLPLVKKEGLPEIARKLVNELFELGINARYDEQHSIGKRYRRHDEAGTPFCITVDGQTKEDKSVTIRDRDTMKQERIPLVNLKEIIQKRLSPA